MFMIEKKMQLLLAAAVLAVAAAGNAWAQSTLIPGTDPHRNLIFDPQLDLALYHDGRRAGATL